jgi:hypothetical protein
MKIQKKSRQNPDTVSGQTPDSFWGFSLDGFSSSDFSLAFVTLCSPLFHEFSGVDFWLVYAEIEFQPA